MFSPSPCAPAAASLNQPLLGRLEFFLREDAILAHLCQLLKLVGEVCRSGSGPRRAQLAHFGFDEIFDANDRLIIAEEYKGVFIVDGIGQPAGAFRPAQNCEREISVQGS